MKSVHPLRVGVIFIICIHVLFNRTEGQSIVPYPVPPEFASEYYDVIINGQRVPVFHAGLNVYFVSFDFTGTAAVSVTSRYAKSGYSGETANKNYIKVAADGYWGRTPLLRPLGKDIRLIVEGPAVSFVLTDAGQYSLEREGTSNFTHDALYIFANNSRITPPAASSNVIYLGAGIHQKHINLSSGQTLYMEPGSVLFGSINVWDADDVTIAGGGTVVYYGPQSETHDDGWKHLQDWHPLTTHNSKKLRVDGITFVARSRTWSVQMYNTFDAVFNNVKVIAVNPQNINGDGFDWYGGGRTRITNSFIRSMDDCFAFFTPGSSEGMWSLDTTTNGEVKDISIENCVLWTSLANVYRIGFSGQNLITDNIAMKNCDVIHISGGGWLAPNSIICAVSPNHKGKSVHSNYTFENVNFEESCAFLGVQNPEAKFQKILFKNVMMRSEPTNSVAKGEVNDLIFNKVSVNGRKVSDPKGVFLPVDVSRLNVKFIEE